MKATPEYLIQQLASTLDPANSRVAVASYIEMQQRYLAGDWKPAELDGGRLCEAVSRCVLQLDSGTVTHSDLPGAICDTLESKKVSHNLTEPDRKHMARVIRMVYKFRSDRGAVHISPVHNANQMDSVLVLHAGKWLLGELLRLAWNADRQMVGEVIEQLVQLELTLIHELDGRPLVLAKNISAPDEVLVLLNHAEGNRLTRAEIRERASNQKANTVNTAISRLIRSKDIRDAVNGEVALTPVGQKRLIEEILPKYASVL